ncbi:hypothetical protein OC844_006616 [Tilletia horrida]|nr:hypothetical protein OC844_006616 [Tilletia horrida]
MFFFKHLVVLGSLAAAAHAQQADSATAPAPADAGSAAAVPAGVAALPANLTDASSSFGQCAIGCATQALNAAGCHDFTDFSCYCTNQPIIDGAISCVGSTCPDAYPVAVQAVKAICTANGQDMSKVNFPATVPKSGSGSASGAGTGTPTSSSSAPASPAPAAAPAKSAANAVFPQIPAATAAVVLVSAAAVFGAVLV